MSGTGFNPAWGDPEDWDAMPRELNEPLAEGLRALGWDATAQGYVEGVEITAADGTRAGLWWGRGGLCAGVLRPPHGEVKDEPVDVYADPWDPPAAVEETDRVLREDLGLHDGSRSAETS